MTGAIDADDVIYSTQSVTSDDENVTASATAAPVYWQRRRRRSQAGRSLGSADGRTDGRMARSSIVVEPSVTVMACHGRASVHCPFSPSPSPVYPSAPPSRRPRLCVFLARPFQSITLTHARAVCPSVRSSAILCCVVFVDRGCWRLRPQVSLRHRRTTLARYRRHRRIYERQIDRV